MCKKEVLLLFEQIQDSLKTIIIRAIPVNTAEDFTHYSSVIKCNKANYY